MPSQPSPLPPTDRQRRALRALADACRVEGAHAVRTRALASRLELPVPDVMELLRDLRDHGYVENPPSARPGAPRWGLTEQGEQTLEPSR